MAVAKGMAKRMSKAMKKIVKNINQSAGMAIGMRQAGGGAKSARAAMVASTNICHRKMA